MHLPQKAVTSGGNKKITYPRSSYFAFEAESACLPTFGEKRKACKLDCDPTIALTRKKALEPESRALDCVDTPADLAKIGFFESTDRPSRWFSGVHLPILSSFMECLL